MRKPTKVTKATIKADTESSWKDAAMLTSATLPSRMRREPPCIQLKRLTTWVLWMPSSRAH